jgi:hypothetical protein
MFLAWPFDGKQLAFTRTADVQEIILMHDLPVTIRASITYFLIFQNLPV